MPGPGVGTAAVAAKPVPGRVPAVPRGRSRRGSALSWTLAALLAAPAAAALASALRRPFLPASDWALIESRVRSVGTSTTPLLGAGSRFGWSHPGPWPFYLLALPYRLIGSAHGILGAAAVWNLLTLLAIALVVSRLDRLLALCAMPVLAVLVLGLGAGFLGDPWNPSLPVLSVALLFPVALAHGQGKRWALPALGALASIIVQAHLGFLPVVAAVVGWALLQRLVAIRRQRLRPADASEPAAQVRLLGGPRHAHGDRLNHTRLGSRAARPLLVTAAVLVVVWLPPAIDQAVNHPGNLRSIYDHVTSPPPAPSAGEEGQVGFGPAAGLFARQFGVPSPWLGAKELRNPFAADRTAGRGRLLDLLPLVLAVGGAAVLALRRGDGTALSLLGLSVAALAGCYVGLAVIRGVPYEWLVKWCRPIAAWSWIAALWAAARAVAARRVRSNRSPIPQWAPAAVAGVVAVASVATIGATTLGRRPDAPSAQMAGRLAPVVLRATRGARGVYLIPIVWPGVGLPQETDGLLVAYERVGRPATLDEKEARRRKFDTAIQLTTDPGTIAAAEGDSAVQIVARVPSGLRGPSEPKTVTVLRKKI